VTAQTPLAVGVLISGSGSNLQAIIDRIAEGHVAARIAVVISNKGDAYGLERARNAGIAAVHVDPKAYPNAVAYNEAVRDELLAAGVELVVMAGYMKLLGTPVLDAFPNRVLNLHPALLPSFPGAHGIADALAYGVKVTGITVHFANEVFDEGPIIAQRAVTIEESDTLETLEAKIHALEHELYPEVIHWYAEGRLEIVGRTVKVHPAGS
jgi:phosphoribosylglycinamide formyltransferase-1